MRSSLDLHNVKHSVLTDAGEELMIALIGMGYDVRIVRTRQEACNKYEAIHEDQIKLEIVEYPTIDHPTTVRSGSGRALHFSEGIHVYIKVKGPRGTWVSTKHFVRSKVLIENREPIRSKFAVPVNRYQYTVDKFIADLSSLEPPKETIDHKKLLQPHDFNRPSIRRSGDSVELVHFYQHVRVVGFGKITDDLKVSTDIESPDSDCWFIIEGHTTWNDADANARMLVRQDADKLVFVPVILFTTKMHICDMTTKGKRVDYNGCTVIDGEMIQEAITNYLSKL